MLNLTRVESGTWDLQLLLAQLCFNSKVLFFKTRQIIPRQVPACIHYIQKYHPHTHANNLLCFRYSILATKIYPQHYFPKFTISFFLKMYFPFIQKTFPLPRYTLCIEQSVHLEFDMRFRSRQNVATMIYKKRGGEKKTHQASG